MSNPFDQFDAPAASGNPFDQFDTLPTAPPAKPLGTLDYLTRKLTQVGGKMMQGASIAGGGLAGAVGMDDLRDQAFDLATNYGKFGKDTEIGVGTNDAAQSMTQRVAGAGVQAIPALAAFVANPALGLGLVSNLSMADSGDLISGGVDAGTAGKVFATDVAGNAVGMLPFVGPALGPIGNTLARRVISGAAANAFQGGATDAAKQSILSGNGYEEQAQQYDPLNPEARIVDLLLGGGTGVHAHYSPEARQQRQGQQEAVARQGRIDSLLAAQEAKVAADTQAAAHAVDVQTYGPILEANGIDPNSPRAQGVIANLKAREALKEQTQAEAQAETVPPSPEEIALAQRQQTPAVIPVDSTGRADAGEQTVGVKASMLDQGGDAALIDSRARFQREQRGADTIEQPNPMDGGRVSGDVLPPDAGTSVVPTGRADGDTINSRPLTPQPDPARLQEPQQRAPQAEQPAADTMPKRKSVQNVDKQFPKNAYEAEIAVQDGNVTRELTGFIKEERDAQTKTEKAAAWRSQFTGKMAETIAAGDISRSDYEKLGDLVYRGKLTADRAVEMIDSASKAGVLDVRVAADMAKRIGATPDVPKSEPTPAKPVAESKAPEPSEPGVGKVATAQDGAASDPKAYPQDQATKLAASMTKKGLPSEAYPHPTVEGQYAIRARGEPAAKESLTPAETPINPDQKGASLGQEKTTQEVLTKTAPKEADPTAGIPKGMFTKVKDVEYDAGIGKKVGTAKEAMRDLNRSLSDYQAFLDCLRG